MFSGVGRVRSLLGKKFEAGLVPEEKRRRILLEPVIERYCSSWSLLFGSLMLSYVFMSSLFFVPYHVTPKTRPLCEFFTTVVSFLLVLVWIFGKYIVEFEKYFRSYDTSVLELFGAFWSSPVPVTVISIPVVEGSSVIDEKKELSPTEAYDKKVAREREQLLQIIEKYVNNSTIYLGNDFLNGITSENQTMLTRKGYFYSYQAGMAGNHWIGMEKPSMCTLF